MVDLWRWSVREVLLYIYTYIYVCILYQHIHTHIHMCVCVCYTHASFLKTAGTKWHKLRDLCEQTRHTSLTLLRVLYMDLPYTQHLDRVSLATYIDMCVFHGGAVCFNEAVWGFGCWGECRKVKVINYYTNGFSVSIGQQLC